MWPLGSYSSAYILEAIDFIFFSLHLVPLRQMQASWKCGALSQSSTTWEQIHVFVWAQLAHEQTLSQGNECLKRRGRAHTLFLKYLGKTDMITENKACLLKKKRERKKIEFLSSNKTTPSIQGQCFAYVGSTWAVAELKALERHLALCELRLLHAHLWACSPGAAATSSGLSLSPLPLGGKAVLSDSTAFASPAHTLWRSSRSPEQMDSRNGSGNKKAKFHRGKTNPRRKKGKTEHWKKLNRPAGRGAQKVFMIVEKLHSDSSVSGGDPWVKRVRKTGSPLWSILTEGVRIWLDLERENQTSLLNKIHAE